MRSSLIAGLILILVGAFVFVRAMSSEGVASVAQVSDVAMATTEAEGIPEWVGAWAVVGGLALVALGATGKRV
jgi:hypothetical protein